MAYVYPWKKPPCITASLSRTCVRARVRVRMRVRVRVRPPGQGPACSNLAVWQVAGAKARAQRAKGRPRRVNALGAACSHRRRHAATAGALGAGEASGEISACGQLPALGRGLLTYIFIYTSILLALGRVPPLSLFTYILTHLYTYILIFFYTSILLALGRVPPLSQCRG